MELATVSVYIGSAVNVCWGSKLDFNTG